MMDKLKLILTRFSIIPLFQPLFRFRNYKSDDTHVKNLCIFTLFTLMGKKSKKLEFIIIKFILDLLPR